MSGCNRIKIIELKLGYCTVLTIFVLVGLGCIVSMGCIVNEAQRPNNSQIIENQKPLVNQEPTVASTLPKESDIPPPLPFKKQGSREDEYNWFSGRLKQKIQEREKEIDLQPIEDLPQSVSEIRLWYFPPFEKIRGIVFSSDNKLNLVILIKNDSKEEIHLDKEKMGKLRMSLVQGNIEELKDIKTIEYTPSPDGSYFVFQIKSGRKVDIKIYPAGVGTNVKPTESSDLCDAAALCGKISGLLSLDFNDCRCTLTKESR